MAMYCFSAVLEHRRLEVRAPSLSQAPNNRLQRTVMDKVPRRVRQRAAAEPERYTLDRRYRAFGGPPCFALQ